MPETATETEIEREGDLDSIRVSMSASASMSMSVSVSTSMSISVSLSGLYQQQQQALLPPDEPEEWCLGCCSMSTQGVCLNYHYKHINAHNLVFVYLAFVFFLSLCVYPLLTHSLSFSASLSLSLM